MFAGLTGGLACGKSFVARTFAEFGAHIIEADELGRQVMQPGEEAFQKVRAEFGLEVLNAEGTIDRAALAALVFRDREKLLRLNAIVHPAVRIRALDVAKAAAAEDPKRTIIYVAAILIETGAYKDCDKLVVVSCTPEQQLERALARDGASEQDIEARIATQMPMAEKLRFADFIIDTSGTKSDTVRQTKLVYEALQEQPL